MFFKPFSKKVLIGSVCLLALSSCSINNTKNALFGKSETTNINRENTRGDSLANKAVVAFWQGNFEKANQYAADSLKKDAYQPQALLISALIAEQNNQPNAAAKFYEDIILRNGEETTVLTTSDFQPVKILDVAKQRLKKLNIKQSSILIEDLDGITTFNISKEGSQNAAQNAINKTLMANAGHDMQNNQQSLQEKIADAQQLFTTEEKNAISRFLVYKELAEKGLITKEEFLLARNTNIGALLPLTNSAPSSTVILPVPSAEVVIDRINVLKESVENREITPREFSAERNLIIQALLPTSPREKLKNKAPNKDILNAAKDIRKLEVLYNLNLITTREKQAEQKAIEKALGIGNKASAPQPAPVAAPAQISGNTENSTVAISKPTDNVVVPNVSSPF